MIRRVLLTVVLALELCAPGAAFAWAYRQAPSGTHHLDIVSPRGGMALPTYYAESAYKKVLSTSYGTGTSHVYPPSRASGVASYASKEASETRDMAVVVYLAYAGGGQAAGGVVGLKYAGNMGVIDAPGWPFIRSGTVQPRAEYWMLTENIWNGGMTAVADRAMSGSSGFTINQMLSGAPAAGSLGSSYLYLYAARESTTYPGWYEWRSYEYYSDSGWNLGNAVHGLTPILYATPSVTAQLNQGWTGTPREFISSDGYNSYGDILGREVSCGDAVEMQVASTDSTIEASSLFDVLPVSSTWNPYTGYDITGTAGPDWTGDTTGGTMPDVTAFDALAQRASGLLWWVEDVKRMIGVQ